jgi:colanic acid/amylovoran biosynthesis protein
MKHILIIQNYNANKGDSSVLYAMVASLREMSGALSVRVTSYLPEKARKDYGIESAEWLVSYARIKTAPRLIAKMYYAARELLWVAYSGLWLACYRLGLRLPLPSSKRRTIQFYLDSDVVVLPGGHFFTTLNGLAQNFSHLYGLWFAVCLGKATMIYAQTIGPFFGIRGLLTRVLTRLILPKVDVITIREKSSLASCRHLTRARLTAECVFALTTDTTLAGSIPQLITLRQSGRPLVGITIHHLYFRRFFSHSQYVSLMSDILGRIATEYDSNILIIPMEESCHGGGDRPLALEIRARCSRPESVHVLADDHDPLSTAAVIASTDVFVGTKTHSIVYGLKAGVPTISISYQEKSNEFMRLFDVAHNAINLSDLNAGEFMKIFDRLMHNLADTRHRQQERLAQVRAMAMENNRLLLGLAGIGA